MADRRCGSRCDALLVGATIVSTLLVGCATGAGESGGPDTAPSASSSASSTAPGDAVEPDPAQSEGSAGADAPGASSSPDPGVPTSGPSPLLPVFPEDRSSDGIRLETVAVSERILAVIDEGTVLNDDVHDQTTEASDTSAAYYGVIQTVTLDPATDPVAVAQAVVDELEAAGWSVRDSSRTDADFLTALLSDQDPAEAWFLVVGADVSVPGQSVVTLQLASPDLPA